LYQLRSYGLLIVVVAFLGCNKAVKSGWTNFNAYYNTYYNAQKEFNEGERKVKNQDREINPERPIPIYPEPIRAGEQNFEVAIDKGADILREYSDSKWVDDALLLIGKSYFYMSKFFDADQKFKELINTTSDDLLKMEGILWQGRVLMEMERYQESISYLTGQLQNENINWDREKKAKVQALIAQLHTRLNNWESANTYLTDALNYMPGGELRSRAYFLRGQVLERLELPDIAFEAYKNVEKDHPEYELVYQAQRKRANIARKTANYDEAYTIFEKMSKDDKNFEIQSQLVYEMARTLQQKGEFKKAEYLYNQVLHNSLNTPDNVTRAKSYYGMAEIHRFYYDDFEKTAAYYDSASTQRANKNKLPENFNAQNLAKIFGEYSKLSQKAYLIDSLLWVGSLNDEQLDSVVSRIRQQKITELRKREKEREKAANTAVVANNRSVPDRTTANQPGNTFLNYQNLDLVKTSRDEFFALWGDRPLVDNWRRMEAIRSTAEDESLNNADTFDDEELVAQAKKQQVQVNLENVPFTKKEKQEKREELAGVTYEMGNLFFLSLDNPDSAAYYYKKVVNQFGETKFHARALYSLSELNFVNNNEKVARRWADSLINSYPDSRFAFRLRQRYGLDTDQQNSSEPVSVDSVKLNYLKLMEDMVNKNSFEKARQYYSFYKKNTESNYAGDALYNAIHHYVKAGKNDSLFTNRYKKWYTAKEEWQYKKSSFQIVKDSASVILQDSSGTLSSERKNYWLNLADSTLPEPNLDKYYPYKGTTWDSARSAIDAFVTNFKKHPEYEEVIILKNELKLPEKKEEGVPGQNQQIAQQNKNPERQNNNKIRPSDITPAEEIPVFTCVELKTRPAVIGGKEKFFNSIEFPEEIQALSMSGSLPYEVVINQKGTVDSVTFLGANSGTNLENIVKDAMLESLRFKPLMMDGKPVKAKCKIAMPINL